MCEAGTDPDSCADCTDCGYTDWVWACIDTSADADIIPGKRIW
jgi:hypothetical protein